MSRFRSNRIFVLIALWLLVQPLLERERLYAAPAAPERASQLVQPAQCPAYLAPTARFGFNLDLGNGKTLAQYDHAALHAGWYLDYDFRGAATEEMAYVRMIRTGQNLETLAQEVGPVVDANPGSLWILGNEPDRDTQDGRTPAEYAHFYHELYAFLKARDPLAQVAIGGVVQSTPLRRRYLDVVLSEYQARYGEPLPVDLFTVHAFVLREDQTWGAGIPPGLDAFAQEGMLYELQQHGDLEIFKQQIRDFRRWMADNGFRNTPLIVSEYGILMPADYGFEYEVVRDFMVGSFDFLRTASDADTGYPADENRLVQWWSWFSLNAPAYDFETQEGYNGNLFDSDSHQINDLGRDFGQYVLEHTPPGIDLALADASVAPALLLASAAPVTVTLAATAHNLGELTAENVQLRVWLQRAASERALLSSSTPVEMQAGVQHVLLQSQWQSDRLQPGANSLWLELVAENGGLEKVCVNNRTPFALTVFEEALDHQLYLPIAALGALATQ